jgi:succinate dehydrogenase / fumarate reductase flavoprotein subunit
MGSIRNQQTNIPNLYAIGECDYQFHGANRLGANSLLSCIFSGLIIGPTIQSLFTAANGRLAMEYEASLFESARKQHQHHFDALLRRPADSGNPYEIHQELGDVMTKAATVVRRNEQLEKAYDQVCELQKQADVCSLSDTGNWTNQNAVFTRALVDMFPIAKTILRGALLRDECRGAHYKPDFAMPSLTAENEQERRAEAEAWCDRFEANNAKWLKSTIARYQDGEISFSYEDVDTSIIPPRPRLYGLAGAEIIDQVWKERQKSRGASQDSPQAATP